MKYWSHGSSIHQILPNSNATQTLVDPFFGITLFFVEFLHPYHSKFGIFDLVDMLLADMRKPAFERLYPGQWDGLDDAKHGPVLAQSVSRIFPSGAGIFICPIFSDTSLYPSVTSLFLRSFQYLRGLSPPTKTSMTSMMENHHSPSCRIFLICLPLKTASLVDLSVLNIYASCQCSH